MAAPNFKQRAIQINKVVRPPPTRRYSVETSNVMEIIDGLSGWDESRRSAHCVRHMLNAIRALLSFPRSFIIWSFNTRYNY